MLASTLKKKPKSDASEKNLGPSNNTHRPSLAHLQCDLESKRARESYVETRRFVLRLHGSSHPLPDAIRLTHCGSGTHFPRGPASAPYCTHAGPRGCEMAARGSHLRFAHVETSPRPCLQVMDGVTGARPRARVSCRLFALSVQDEGREIGQQQDREDRTDPCSALHKGRRETPGAQQERI